MFETRLTTALVAAYEQAGHWRGQTLLDFVAATAHQDPERLALVDARSRITYRQLVAAVDRVALGLLELGLRKGDVVSVQLPNRAEFAVLMLAIERVGAAMNPLVTILRQRELVQVLRLGRPRLLVVPDAFHGFDYAAMALELRTSAPELQRVLVVGPHAPEGTLGWDDLLGTPWEEQVDPRVLDYLRPDPNDVIQVAFTSGTTGEPKGVLHTHNTTVCIVGSTIRRQRLTHRDVVLAATPVGHQAGYLWGVRVALQAGATVVFQETWDAEEAVRLIEQHRVTFTMGATTFLIDLLGARNLPHHGLRSLRNFTTAGSNVPPSVAAEMERRLPGRLCRAFGMTEQGHTTATAPDSAREKVLSTDGLPQPEMEVKIVDEDGRRLGPGQEGRLRLRGPFNFVGYVQGRAFTAPFFDGEDFFDTGDLAELDADGYIRVTGRIKDLIVRGGEKVPVKEIEDLLMSHPKVAGVALVPVPDERLGERALACIRPRPGESLTLQELKAFLEERRVTRQFWPEGLVLYDELPTTPAGKIQKFQLQEDARRRLAEGAAIDAPLGRH